MKNITKRIHFVMSKQDENLFEDKIKHVNPDIKYLDDNVWDKPKAKIKNALTDCQSNYVYLWDEKSFPSFSIKEKYGKFHGPQSAMVIQMERCQTKDKVILIGCMAVTFTIGGGAFDDMKVICNQVWKVIKKLGNNKLKSQSVSTNQTLCDLNFIYALPNACKLIENGIVFKNDESNDYYITV